MDKDRIKGSAAQAKGAVKEVAGKVLGDKKLETEGKTEQAVGKPSESTITFSGRPVPSVTRRIPWTKAVIGRSLVGWFAGSCTRRDLRGISGSVNIVGVACEFTS